jgi:GxxExxY protein
MDLLLKDECYEIIGACMEVHRNLGGGFLEAVYQEALALELGHRDIPYSKEEKLEITYKGTKLEKYYMADFICYDNIIVELKALNSLASEHEAQLLNYLKASGKRLGILVNFGEKSLKYKRMVL